MTDETPQDIIRVALRYAWEEAVSQAQAERALDWVDSAELAVLDIVSKDARIAILEQQAVMPADVRAALEYVVSRWLLSSSSRPLSSHEDYSDRMLEIRAWLDAQKGGDV